MPAWRSSGRPRRLTAPRPLASDRWPCTTRSRRSLAFDRHPGRDEGRLPGLPGALHPNSASQPVSRTWTRRPMPRHRLRVVLPLTLAMVASPGGGSRGRTGGIRRWRADIAWARAFVFPVLQWCHGHARASLSRARSVAATAESRRTSHPETRGAGDWSGHDLPAMRRERWHAGPRGLLAALAQRRADQGHAQRTGQNADPAGTPGTVEAGTAAREDRPSPPAGLPRRVPGAARLPPTRLVAPDDADSNGLPAR
jgi:hypothetical protein